MILNDRKIFLIDYYLKHEISNWKTIEERDWIVEIWSTVSCHSEFNTKLILLYKKYKIEKRQEVINQILNN
jgi:hypothetical protein